MYQLTITQNFNNMSDKYCKQLELFTEKEVKKRKAKIEKLQKEIDYYNKKLEELLQREYKPINH